MSKLNELELYAWVGEDEFGSGEIGLKQALVPAGYIPLVATKREKMEPLKHIMGAQAALYGKRIRLCRFRFDSVVAATESGEG